MDMTLNNPCWGKMQAPWLKKEEPIAEKAAA
jgi:nitrogenase molybdenum-iron protein alpha chain